MLSVPCVSVAGSPTPAALCSCPSCPKAAPREHPGELCVATVGAGSTSGQQEPRFALRARSWAGTRAETISAGSSWISPFLSPWWHCNENMKEEDNTEGRKIRPFFSPLSLPFRMKCEPWRAGPSDLSAQQLASGARGRCYCAAPLLGGLLSLARGRREKTEAKQDAGVQWGARDICYQNGNASLC